MTRRKQMHKWLIYSLGLIPIWLLDAYILPRYPMWGISPMLLPPAVVAVSVLEGIHAGTGFGLAVGLLWELAYPGGFGGLVLAMALVGAITGGAAQYALSQSLPGCLLCTAGVLAALDGFRVAGGLIAKRAELAALLQIAIPECLLSLAWTPAVYLLFRCIHRRVGGSRLA